MRRCHIPGLGPCGLPLLLLAVALVGISPSPAGAATREQRLEEAFNRSWERTSSPGAQAAVLHRGELVWKGAAGKAVLRGRRVSNQTLFAFASLGKTMLAAYALDRVEAGRLELDVPIEAYVGSSVLGSDRVTLRMLLAHTAGYPEIYANPPLSTELGADYDPNRRWTFSKVFQALREPVDPGQRWEYSNAAYIVLAYLLSRTADRPLADATLDFFRPAGIVEPVNQRSLTMRRNREAARNFAHGFVFGIDPPDTFTGARTIPTDLYGTPWGDGIFAGTALGAARFLDGLLARSRLLAPATVRSMITPTPQAQASGSPLPEDRTYGLGTYRLSHANRVWQGHDGGYVGFRSMGFTDPKRGVTIVVATNGYRAAESSPALRIWRALASAYATRTGGR